MPNFLTAQWQNLIMANYAVPPDVLTPYLPKGVELDFYEGQTYVSLVGFMFRDSKIFSVPIPVFGTFEEINLRFYVKRKVGDEWRRGVVFVSETVPSKVVAFIANHLYKEHYVSVPTKHTLTTVENTKQVKYEWKLNNTWNRISVDALNASNAMKDGGVEEFIFEHYYGYTKIDSGNTEEYKILHPRWKVHQVMNYEIKCDFAAMFGIDFSFLQTARPDSIMLAEGSSIAVEWQRIRI